MKINQIIVETSTTAGVIATVDKPLGEVQARPHVDGLEPISKIMKGKAKKKGPYANSLSEGKKRVQEADLSEDDVILVPGQGRIRKSGFIKHDPDKAEHEGETLKNSLHTIIRMAKELDRELSVRDSFPEWVSEKIGATKGMMITIAEYLQSAKEMQHDPDAMEGMTGAGVIAGGPQYEAAQAPISAGRRAGKAGKPLAPPHPKGSKEYSEFEKGWNEKEDIRKKNKLAPYDKLDEISQDTAVSYAGKRMNTDTTDKSPAKIDKMIKGLKGAVARAHGEKPTSPAKKQQGVGEGAKVDRMVKHVAQSEKKLGHSKKEAENIAWATANKRGMLDNKNKKAK